MNSLYLLPQKAGFTLLELLLAIAILGIIAMFSYKAYEKEKERVENTTAISDIRIIESKITQFAIINFSYPASLADLKIEDYEDPWGNPYVYLNIANAKGKGKLRKDKNLVPINSDFDLYSKGRDGKSVSPLTAAASQDDIVRANNGRFVGLAKDY
jgi:general secretion pathway protein G